MCISSGGLRTVVTLVVFGLLMSTTGCSVKRFATNALANAIAEGGATYASDDDLELVGAATPFGLKTIEGLLEETPEHRGLLLAAAKGFTQYAYAFVEVPAERLEAYDVAGAYAGKARARRLYLRARNYGLRALELDHPGLRVRLHSAGTPNLDDLITEEVALLYWTGVAWAAAIALSKDDPGLLADIPAMSALMERALELDHSFEHGALHVFFIVFEMSRPTAGDHRFERARQHFQQALELSDRRQATPYVALAESVAVAEQNRLEFETLLREALLIDPQAVAQWTLVNTLMQRRARWLLANADYYFSD